MWCVLSSKRRRGITGRGVVVCLLLSSLLLVAAVGLGAGLGVGLGLRSKVSSTQRLVNEIEIGNLMDHLRVSG